MQLIRRTSTTPKRKALRPVAISAAATLLLAGWTSVAKADLLIPGAHIIPSSAFVTPPPATVFGDFPTATIVSGGSQIDFYSFNALPGQQVRIDIDNAANGSVTHSSSTGFPDDDLQLALFSGNGAVLAANNNSALDPGSIPVYDGHRQSTDVRDPFIGTYTLTYPNSNIYGNPIDFQFDPNGNTYYVAVIPDGRFASQQVLFPSDPSATTSNLTRPDGAFGGTAFSYSPLGFDVSRGLGISNQTRYDYGISPYTLQISLSPAPTAPVPEPGTMALMGLGIAGLAASRRRKKNKVEATAVLA